MDKLGSTVVSLLMGLQMARDAAVVQPVKATVLLGVDSVPQMRTGLVVSSEAGSGVSLSLAQNLR